MIPSKDPATQRQLFTVILLDTLREAQREGRDENWIRTRLRARLGYEPEQLALPLERWPMIVDLDKDDLKLRLEHYPKAVVRAVRARCQAHAERLHQAATKHPTATWAEIGVATVEWPPGLPNWLIWSETEKTVRLFSLNNPVVHPWRDIKTRSKEHVPAIQESGTEEKWVAPLYMEDSCHLSNKSCRHCYVNFSGQPETGRSVGNCTCPEDRCWYREQQDRRKLGQRAIHPDHWPKAGAILFPARDVFDNDADFEKYGEAFIYISPPRKPQLPVSVKKPDEE